MKHAVTSKKPPTKPHTLAGKAVLETSVKSVQTVKKISKSSLKDGAANPVKKAAAKTSVTQVIEPKIEKNALGKSPKRLKTKIVETAQVKTQNVKAERVLTVKVVAKKNQPPAPIQNSRAEAVKVQSIVMAKTAKTKIRKTESVPAIKQIAIVAVPETLTVLKNPLKSSSKKTQPAIVAEKIVATTTKPKSPRIPIAKVQPAGKEIKATVAADQSSVKVVGKIKKTETAEAGEKVELKNSEFKKAEVKEAEVIENNTKSEKPPTAQMLRKMAAELIISAKENRIQAQIRNRKTAPAVQIKKPEIVEKKIEEIETPLPPKPKNKKAKLIGSAIFRGKKERYDFKVFALDETFEPIPAVYIISKRTTDTRKKAHHALICIGETHSVFDELKKHRKGKCVKKHQANVVSILPEADEKIRLKIETDLKAAHSVACLLD